MPSKLNIIGELGKVAVSWLQRYRNHVLLLGGILLIYGGGMYAYRGAKTRILAWIDSRPKKVSVFTPAYLPPPPSPVKAPPEPANEQPLSLPADNPPKALPPEIKMYRVLGDGALHLYENTKVTPQSVAVDSSRTKITFLVDASNTGGARVCPPIGSDGELPLQWAQEQYFIIDNNGKRYKLLAAPWPFPEEFGRPKCQKLVEGERFNLELDFEPLDEGVTSVSSYWGGAKITFSLNDSHGTGEPDSAVSRLRRYKALGGSHNVNGLEVRIQSVEVTAAETKALFRAESLS